MSIDLLSINEDLLSSELALQTSLTQALQSTVTSLKFDLSAKNNEISSLKDQNAYLLRKFYLLNLEMNRDRLWKGSSKNSKAIDEKNSDGKEEVEKLKRKVKELQDTIHGLYNVSLIKDGWRFIYFKTE
jgi:regulator of replication initiation timing